MKKIIIISAFLISALAQAQAKTGPELVQKVYRKPTNEIVYNNAMSTRKA